MYVCLIKHPGCEKKYLFDCTNVQRKLAVGDEVVCETIRGLQIGKVVSFPVEMGEGRGAQAIIEEIGAYWPLKQIVRKLGDVELLEEEKRIIAKQYIREHANSPDELPF